MSAVLKKLSDLGLKLPDPPAAGGNYLPFRIVGNLVFLPGVISSWNGALTQKGKVGADLTIEDGYEGAKICALNLLANLQAAIGLGSGQTDRRRERLRELRSRLSIEPKGHQRRIRPAGGGVRRGRTPCARSHRC